MRESESVCETAARSGGGERKRGRERRGTDEGYITKAAPTTTTPLPSPPSYHARRASERSPCMHASRMAQGITFGHFHQKKTQDLCVDTSLDVSGFYYLILALLRLDVRAVIKAAGFWMTIDHTGHSSRARGQKKRLCVLSIHS